MQDTQGDPPRPANSECAEPERPVQNKERLRELARAHGFDRVGFAPAGPFPEANHFHDWLESGYHGHMAYLAKNPEWRADPTQRRPWVQSFVVLAVDYHTAHPLSIEVPDDPDRGWISRYAWGRDYHDVLEKRLRALAKELEQHDQLAGRYHYYVDHGPVLERLVGYYAGLGWIGKNAMLIHPDHGSFFFLAVILTDQAFEPDQPIADHCGSCNRCLTACPTQAFVGPRRLDATRCISYRTIEVQDAPDPSFQEQSGFHIFGCDLCQDVCPYNRWATPTQEPAFQPRPGLVHPSLEELRRDTQEQWAERFTKSPVKRRKYPGFQQNLASAQSRAGTENFPNPQRTRTLRPAPKSAPRRKQKNH